MQLERLISKENVTVESNPFPLFLHLEMFMAVREGEFVWGCFGFPAKTIGPCFVWEFWF